MMSYKKNFLDTVIYRIDFTDFLTDESVCSKVLEECVIKNFPEKSMDRIVQFGNINLEFDDDGKIKSDSKNEVKSGVQREFSNGINKVSISNQFVVFEIKEYDNFNVYSETLFELIKTLTDKFKINTERIGVRYINIYNCKNITIRKNYFSKEIALAVFSTLPEMKNDVQLIRDLHRKEYKKDDLKFNFQYGTFNPQYPNILKNNSFVLDLDSYTNAKYSNKDDIIEKIHIAHKSIKILFEEAITDKLREKMNK